VKPYFFSEVSTIEEGTLVQSAYDHSNYYLSSAVQSNNFLDDISINFELLDREDKLVSDEDYRGKYILLSFGVTHCEYICPMVVSNMAKAIELTDKNIVGLFVSIDAERDTPAITNCYAKSFNKKIVGLSGSYKQVSNAANNFKVSFAITKTQNNYTVQHTSNVYLIGPDDKLWEVSTINASPVKIFKAIKQ